MLERLPRRSVAATAAVLLAATGAGGVAIAKSGGSNPKASENTASESREAPGAESSAPENSAADGDNIQDENGTDDAREGKEEKTDREDGEGKESPSDDGPGGHAVTGDDGETQARGPDADRAKAAALDLVPGGTANAVERDGEHGATWEVEVRRPDGSTVDVRLGADFRRVAIDSDSEKE